MSLPDEKTRETLLAELDFHKTEFENLRGEILQWLEAERQYINLCLIGIGAEVGLIPIMLDHQIFAVLLLFPFVFQVLLWEMLNAVQGIHALSSYLTNKLIPRVNAIFARLGNESKETILGWEIQAAQRTESGASVHIWTLALESLMPSRFWAPILAIAVSLVAYILLATGYDHAISLWEITLIFLNLAFLLASAIRSTLMTRLSAKRARQFQRGRQNIGERWPTKTAKPQQPTTNNAQENAKNHGHD